jgi:hypothetical protein
VCVCFGIGSSCRIVLWQQVKMLEMANILLAYKVRGRPRGKAGVEGGEEAEESGGVEREGEREREAVSESKSEREWVCVCVLWVRCA